MPSPTGNRSDDPPLASLCPGTSSARFYTNIKSHLANPSSRFLEYTPRGSSLNM